jgi:protein kinase A
MKVWLYSKTPHRISIEDFKIIKGVSSGAYGKVCLVQKISSKDYFAMKIIDREKTAEKKARS